LEEFCHTNAGSGCNYLNWSFVAPFLSNRFWKPCLQGIGENYIMRSLLICTPHPIFFGLSHRRMRWARRVALKGKRRSVYGFGVGNLRERATWKTQA
jgi:hypothetical protein